MLISIDMETFTVVEHTVKSIAKCWEVAAHLNFITDNLVLWTCTVGA